MISLFQLKQLENWGISLVDKEVKIFYNITIYRTNRTMWNKRYCCMVELTECYTRPEVIYNIGNFNLMKSNQNSENK